MWYPRPYILKPTKRSEQDWDAYEKLVRVADQLKAMVRFHKWPAFIRPVPKNNGYFSRNKAGRKLLEITETFNTTTSMVMTVAHELGHAMSCVVNPKPYTDCTAWFEENPTDYIREEETAWALGEILLDEIGYQRSSQWSRLKHDSLGSYYRSHLREGFESVEAGRAKIAVDMDDIASRAWQIRTSPKVARLLPVPPKERK